MEKSNCKENWVGQGDGLGYCPTHKQHFWTKKKETCKFFSDGTSQIKKKDSIDTKNNVNKNKKVVASQRLIVDLHEKGLSQSMIASRLDISQQRVSKVLRSLKLGSDNRERFHNFSLTFNAVFNYWSFPYKDVKFGHTQYKVYHTEDFHVQIFVNGRIMVRYNKDVIGKNIVDNQAEAIRRILEFLDEWNKFDVRFIDYVISSGENEFMNSPIAKHIASKGQRILYKDRVDGKKRSIIDFSPSSSNPSGAPHFEHVHKLHFNPDSQKWEEILDNVATGNYLPLDVTKEKIEANEKDIRATMDVLNKVSSSIDELNKVTLLEIENKKLHQGVLIEMKDAMKNIRDEVRGKESDKTLKNNQTYSRYDVEKKERVKNLLKDWGW